jgi:hypothetical protein
MINSIYSKLKNQARVFLWIFYNKLSSVAVSHYDVYSYDGVQFSLEYEFDSSEMSLIDLCRIVLLLKKVQLPQGRSWR